MTVIRELEAAARPQRSKGSRNTLRKSGRIPAVVYGKNINGKAITIDANKLAKIIQAAGANALIDLKLSEDGKTSKYKVLVKTLQRDPFSRKLIHVDFHQVSLKDKVFANVAVLLKGEAAGVADGGILMLLEQQVEVECLATQIPESIDIDVSAMALGETITVADLNLPPGVAATAEPGTPIVLVAAQKSAADAEAAAGSEVEETPEAGAKTTS